MVASALPRLPGRCAVRAGRVGRRGEGGRPCPVSPLLPSGCLRVSEPTGGTGEVPRPGWPGASETRVLQGQLPAVLSLSSLS